MKFVKAYTVKEESFEDFLKEWEKNEERVVPYSARRRDMPFGEIINRWKFEETDAIYEEGFVPSELYFLLDGDKIVGAVSLRLNLNDHLKQIGGHIGYGVRPSERKKGHVTRMMKETLKITKEKGIGPLFLTCDEDNIASYKTIEKFGGELKEIAEYEGKMIRRYWIND